MSLAGDALFDTNSAQLKPKAAAQLDDVVAKLKDVQLERVQVTGYTDNTGAAAYNVKLSQARAEAVKKYLASKGVDANRIHTDGKGAANPAADNKTAAGRAANRRVELEVTGSRTVTAPAAK